MEDRAKHVLKTSHNQITTLLNEIHECRLHKLQNFHKIVAHELSSLETEVQTLKQFEKETVSFWEEQYVKMNTFCTSQKQRIKTMDSKIEETLSNLKNVIEKKTKIIEGEYTSQCLSYPRETSAGKTDCLHDQNKMAVSEENIPNKMG
ncbi:hypothetical protein GDO86_011253 [Hymenochirus boettgeri]|uniref:Uncharacterized protein n=1 Tax=Hymenochirus boettgeri TaxID=247094 RepID=A0A8T2JAU7_9PIPI|nr:hypothetical protein GDO86_011253 [Hymenochirus boettgeri]